MLRALEALFSGRPLAIFIAIGQRPKISIHRPIHAWIWATASLRFRCITEMAGCFVHPKLNDPEESAGLIIQRRG